MTKTSLTLTGSISRFVESSLEDFDRYRQAAARALKFPPSPVWYPGGTSTRQAKGYICALPAGSWLEIPLGYPQAGEHEIDRVLQRAQNETLPLPLNACVYSLHRGEQGWSIILARKADLDVLRRSAPGRIEHFSVLTRDGVKIQLRGRAECRAQRSRVYKLLAGVVLPVITLIIMLEVLQTRIERSTQNLQSAQSEIMRAVQLIREDEASVVAGRNSIPDLVAFWGLIMEARPPGWRLRTIRFNEESIQTIWEHSNSPDYSEIRDRFDAAGLTSGQFRALSARAGYDRTEIRLPRDFGETEEP